MRLTGASSDCSTGAASTAGASAATASMFSSGRALRGRPRFGFTGAESSTSTGTGAASGSLASGTSLSTASTVASPCGDSPVRLRFRRRRRFFGSSCAASFGKAPIDDGKTEPWSAAAETRERVGRLTPRGNGTLEPKAAASARGSADMRIRASSSTRSAPMSTVRIQARRAAPTSSGCSSAIATIALACWRAASPERPDRLRTRSRPPSRAVMTRRCCASPDDAASRQAQAET